MGALQKPPSRSLSPQFGNALLQSAEYPIGSTYGSSTLDLTPIFSIRYNDVASPPRMTAKQWLVCASSVQPWHACCHACDVSNSSMIKGGAYCKNRVCSHNTIASSNDLWTRSSGGVGGNARRQTSQGRKGHRGPRMSNPALWRPALTCRPNSSADELRLPSLNKEIIHGQC